jgi:hypothetical protein
MTQTFNFTTNIEKRMPNKGKVFCVDRMTSDYADQHPLDVDGFIESVYQEFAGTEFEESREVLHGVWTAVLSVISPCGDASLYPNNYGRKRAAAMKVWHKAGDYWRRGLRIGDTLPDMEPMTKITRLDGGSWIALFPKDEHLLTTTNFTNDKNDESTEEVNTNDHELNTNDHELENVNTDGTDCTDNIEPVRNQSEPQQLDLFAFQQLQQENGRLRLQLSQAQEQPRPRRQRKQSSERPCSVRSGSVAASQAACPAIPLQENNSDLKDLFKAIGMVAVATVALFVIYETGLLIPLGLIGLVTGGLLK